MKYLPILGLLAVMYSCGEEDKKKGRSLNIPAIQPPVVEATPSGLGATALRGQFLQSNCGNDAGTPVERLKSRLFCPGPGDFRYRLGMIDGRIAEYDQRAQENLPVCVDDPSVTWNPTGIPSGEEFPVKISCYEQMFDPSTTPSGLTVYFGQDEEHSYIIEAQDPPESEENMPQIGVYARISNNGDDVMFWQATYEDGKSSWMQLKANREDKTMEFVAAGTSMGYGVGCGVNLKSNAEFIYMVGVVNDPGFPGGCDNAEGGWGDIDLNVDLCLNSESLEEVEKDQCEAAGLTELALSRYTATDVGAWDDEGLALRLVTSGGLPSGIRSFTESRLPTEGDENE